MIKQILNLLCLVLLTANIASAAGSRFSYLYIQGDKQTPFYVKLEDAMQPRFGKNYCIIPQPAPGPAHIEILFQQNVFPPQRFTVRIPEGGSRGFLLVKSEGGFSLYDLQQGFYLPAGNKADDDHLPVITDPAPATAAAEQEKVADEAPAKVLPSPKDKVPAVKKATQKSQPTHLTEGQPAQQQVPRGNGQPEFIGGMELGLGDRRDTGGSASSNDGEHLTIANSDCPAPLSNADFGKVFSAMSAMTTDEDRLEYMTGQLNLCYATWQARTLAGKFEGDAARYELLRKIYPRISDQAAFPLLDDLLSSETWKAEFNRLVRH